MDDRDVLRRRKTPSTGESLLRRPPAAISTVDELRKALLQVRERATTQGLLPDDFVVCLKKSASAVVSVEEKPKPRTYKRELNKRGQLLTVATYKSPRWCVLRCVKMIWICLLLCFGLGLLAVYCEPVNFHLGRVMHTRMYDIFRFVRLGVASFLPLVGVNVQILSGCILENPFVKVTQRCPCLTVDEVVSVELEDGALPTSAFQDLQQVLVVWNATRISQEFGLEMLKDFYQTHGEDHIARICAEYSIGKGGPTTYQHLFDASLIEKLLAEGDQWSFIWKECPDSQSQLSLRSLFPLHLHLPPGLFLHHSSLFAFSSQWAMGPYIHDTPSSPLVLVSVLHGEVRFVVNAASDDCGPFCTELKHHPTLRSGDVMIFDQRLWSYETYTWSNTSLVSTTTLEN